MAGGVSQRRGGDLLVSDARRFPGGERAERLDVRIADGVVVETGEELRPAGEKRLDARGLTVIPGLVDVHVHFRDPGLQRKEGWERGSAGALHGGVTSVVEVQNNPPLSTSLAALEARIEHVRARSRVDFGCLANLLPESLEALPAMAPLTPAFKCFLGGSTGVGGVLDEDLTRALFDAAARAGRMVVGHCEDERLLQEGRLAFANATAAEHHLVRSSEAEVESVRAAIAHSEATGAQLHVFHVSTAGACELLRDARRRGVAVFASTAPHYLLLSCDDAARLGNLMKVNPSIKTREDGEALLAALVEGTLDAIGTDHAPHPLDEKRRPYAKAPSGMPSVDLLWPLVHLLARSGRLEPGLALEVVTRRAAASLHLPRKGRLEPGYDGDLVLYDSRATRRVVGAELPSASRWSAFEGLELGGFPEMVVLRGELVFAAGIPLRAAGGRPLDLEPPAPRGGGL